ncbi:MAG: Gfo/Idh/MocA family oxidoreductase, partial [Anaerolineales bacterium]
MRFIICGLGSIGRRHLRNLMALGQHDVILYRTGKSTLPDDELSGLQVEYDLATALDRWQPDAVVVANPTSMHLEAAIPAAEAGCHLLIEKPISHSLEGIDNLRTGLKTGGGRALVGFQFRFHPGLIAAKRLLEDEAVGRPISVRAHWGEYLPDWHPWEDYRLSYSARADLGGGVVLTLCHPFDYLGWIFGEVMTVKAEVGSISDLGLEVEDTAEITLTFKNGPLASVHLDYNQRPASHWLEIIGNKGTIRWDNADGVVHWWSTEKAGWQMIPAPKDFERNTMFLHEMRHFLNIIVGKEQPICSLEDGIRALEIALAVKRAALENSRSLIRSE